jgi:peptide/nickel transport system substrate-binding protein
MQSNVIVRERLYRRMLLALLAVLFPLCAAPVNAAPEPGTITIVLAGELENVDPGSSISGLTGQVLKNIVEPLLDRNPDDGRILPRLATAWKQIDPQTWQFSLRKGVKFHDGEDFNAEAVVFNVKRIYEPKANSRVRGKFFSTFKMEGKALDSYTVELKLDKPEPLLPTLMGFLTMCSPKTPLDGWTRQPIGTGPYKFVRWDAGTQIILERFDGYWGKQPQVKKAIFVWRKESAVRAAMVEIGEADLTPNIAKEDARSPEMDHSYLNTETTYLRFGGIWEPPLNDKRVRMAMNYAVDRDAIRGTILSKDSVPATQIIMPTISGYNPDVKLVPYNPQMAKQLLDEARKDGVPVNREITLVGRIGYYPGCEEILEAIMTTYRAVGLNVKVKMVEVGIWETNYRRKPFPQNAGPYLIQMSHDNNFGDAGFTSYYAYGCKGTASSLCDKRVDDLIEKAQVASGEERKKLWQTVFKYTREDIVADVMLYHMVAYCRFGKRIKFEPSLLKNIDIPIAQITLN